MANAKNAPVRRANEVPPTPVVEEPVQAAPQPAPVVEGGVATPFSNGTSPTTISLVTELDSYIAERIKSQPKTVEEVEQRVEHLSRAGLARHRQVLPEFFEKLSYDCTWREGCPYHTNGFQGRCVFRWIFKDKRAIDNAVNNVGWAIVNRALFPSAPRDLIAASGGVEVGDIILAFIPVKRALEIRDEPGRRSRERLESRMTQVDSDYVLMTGDPKNEAYYKPDLPPESVERSGATAEETGALVEGRDFEG